MTDQRIADLTLAAVVRAAIIERVRDRAWYRRMAANETGRYARWYYSDLSRDNDLRLRELVRVARTSSRHRPPHPGARGRADEGQGRRAGRRRLLPAGPGVSGLTRISDILASDAFLEYADFRRAQLRDSMPCPSCHAPEPARLGRFRGIDGCSECLDFPRCLVCRGWVGDGFLPEERVVALADGSLSSICVRCYEKTDLEAAS